MTTDKIRLHPRLVRPDSVAGVFFPLADDPNKITLESAKEIAVKAGLWARIVQIPSLLYEEGEQVTPLTPKQDQRRKGAKPRSS